MNPPAQYRLITISDIDLSDKQYTLNPFTSTEPDKDKELVTNVRKFGVLHPPLLLELDVDRFIVLSGRKRIQITAAYISPVITALVINRKYVDKHQLVFSTLLQHQLIGSSLSIIEQAMFFKMCITRLPAEDVINFLPILGYRKKSHIPAELISLLELDSTAKLELHKGRLSQRAGKKLLQFPSADQQILAGLINELQMGGSKQLKLIELVLELTKRLQTSSCELLKIWQEKEKDKQHNGPQKAASLLRWLQRKCSPRSTAEEENFTKFCRQLQLPAGARLSHTISFEDERVTLKLDFISREQLEKTWPYIKTILQREKD